MFRLWCLNAEENGGNVWNAIETLYFDDSGIWDLIEYAVCYTN